MQDETAVATAQCTVNAYAVEELNASLATKLEVGHTDIINVGLNRGIK